MNPDKHNFRFGADAQRQGFWLAVILFGLVLAVFYPVTGGDFVSYDDDVYVTANYHVQSGFGAKEVAWAFTNTDAANWHPLTWLSHMLDFQLYGMRPGGHHFTSVALHALNAALLFGVMRAMTGTMWRSLAVALVFGLHPLRVESVAWISERKDVLSGTFWLLAMWFYASYARELKGKDFKRPLYYWLAVLFFICGLMSKPMVVTLPFVLLLMDWWPLNRILNWSEPARFPQVTLSRALAEKVPFLLLSAAGCAVTFMAQKSGGAITDVFKLSYRIETAVQAYARYVGKFLYPANLAVLYPHPAGGWGRGEITAAAAVLAGISALVLAGRRSHPYGLAGWLWFLGTLVPVIGLVQVGSQAMADRYMYLPGIGLSLMAVWGGWELAERWRLERTVVAAGAAAGILCLAVTEHQMIYWKDSGTLFGRAAAVTENSYMARKALGDFYWAEGNGNEAIKSYRQALELYPRFESAHLNLGTVLNGMGRTNEAADEFRQAIALKPDDSSAYNDLGAVVAAAGNMDEAIKLFQKATEVNPRDADAWKNLGRALDEKGRREEAMADFRRDLALRPDAQAHYFLGMDLGRLGRKEAAAQEFTEALRLLPDYSDARQALEALGYKAAP